MCPPSYHDNGLMATHALGYMIYGDTLLVPIAGTNEPKSAQQAKSKIGVIYIIMKTMCPPGYHQKSEN